MQQEEQIIQFLNPNAGRLAPAFTHPSFFSGKSWAEIQSLLLQQLKQIREQLMQVLRQIIKRPDGRRALAGPYTSLHYDLRARYIDELYGVAAENAW